MPLPQHVAIIMDGNGRWATARNLPRAVGHQQGAEAVRKITEYVATQDISYLTLYAFSTENWARPQAEVDALMALLASFLQSELQSMLDNNIKLHIIGDTSALSQPLRAEIQTVIDATASSTGLTLTLAINYGGRDEILRASQRLVRQLVAEGTAINEIPALMTAERLGACLDTGSIPAPDLIIRTAGEQRLSNFLLWQAAYAELYFTEVCWPDFGKDNFDKAMDAFRCRTRKFGGTAEQDTRTAGEPHIR